MAIHLSAPRATELKPRIVVFGVGGAGGNAVNNMIDAGLEGVEFVVANTDAQQLAFSKTDRRIQLGVSITQGLGAGAHPEVGQSAAEESIPEIDEHLDGAHMVFITAGMGGGTGTGAAPIIAKAARERGILTVGVVTKPFMFEGRHRMRLADSGVLELQRYVDTLIVIPNQNLFRIANEKTTFAEAFGMADQVLHSGVRSITDLMVLPGLINLDFADVRSVMTEMGKAMMGTGEAGGEDRALNAAHNAIQNPLLDEVSLKGAKAVLVNVTGGLDMTLLEVDEAANAISSEVDADANIIFGAAFDPSLEGKIRVSVVATGMESASMAGLAPVARPAATAAPLIAPRAGQSAVRPVIGQVASEPAPLAAAMTPEPVVAMEPLVESEDLVEIGSLWPEAAVAAAAETPSESQRPTIRIIDPSVAEEDDDLYLEAAPATREPAIQPPRYAQERTAAEAAPDETYEDIHRPEPKKGAWLSLFGGRPRYDAPASASRLAGPPPSGGARVASHGGAAQAVAHAPSEALETNEDLDIPSFLRRLAN
ncbi:MAG TPA: cell division protein FtsZ [Caulobacteraceae bacterium]|nr:cell division protein FtsZ [Caulobacteraceae bacterium]